MAWERLRASFPPELRREPSVREVDRSIQELTKQLQSVEGLKKAMEEAALDGGKAAEESQKAYRGALEEIEKRREAILKSEGWRTLGSRGSGTVSRALEAFGTNADVPSAARTWAVSVAPKLLLDRVTAPTPSGGGRGGPLTEAGGRFGLEPRLVEKLARGSGALAPRASHAGSERPIPEGQVAEYLSPERWGFGAIEVSAGKGGFRKGFNNELETGVMKNTLALMVEKGAPKTDFEALGKLVSLPADGNLKDAMSTREGALQGIERLLMEAAKGRTEALAEPFTSEPAKTPVPAELLTSKEARDQATSNLQLMLQLKRLSERIPEAKELAKINQQVENLTKMLEGSQGQSNRTSEANVRKELMRAIAQRSEAAKKLIEKLQETNPELAEKLRKQLVEPAESWRLAKLFLELYERVRKEGMTEKDAKALVHKIGCQCPPGGGEGTAACNVASRIGRLAASAVLKSAVSGKSLSAGTIAIATLLGFPRDASAPTDSSKAPVVATKEKQIHGKK